MKDLTKKQKAVLDFIVSCAAEAGSSPTVREVAGHFGICIGPAQKYLSVLVKKGHLLHRPGVARGIGLASHSPSVQVPVLGQIRAGLPDIPFDAAAGHICVDKAIVGDGKHFALKVKGDSMTGAGIFEGDTIVVRKQPVAENNDIVVALVDGEATVKRLRKAHERAWLEAANPSYRPIESSMLTILGKVVYLARKI